MQFAVPYNGKEMIIDIITWESAMNNRVEYYAVFAEQEETFVNFVRCSGQPLITEVSSSADLPTEIKAVIKDHLIYCLQHSK